MGRRMHSASPQLLWDLLCHVLTIWAIFHQQGGSTSLQDSMSGSKCREISVLCVERWGISEVFSNLNDSMKSRAQTFSYCDNYVVCSYHLLKALLAFQFTRIITKFLSTGFCVWHIIEVLVGFMRRRPLSLFQVIPKNWLFSRFALYWWRGGEKEPSTFPKTILLVLTQSWEF